MSLVFYGVTSVDLGVATKCHSFFAVLGWCDCGCTKLKTLKILLYRKPENE